MSTTNGIEAENAGNLQSLPAPRGGSASPGFSTGRLALALAKAQAVMGGASKDAKGNFGKYATLASVWDACREPLSKHGIAVVQMPAASGAQVTVRTVLMHESGEVIESAVSATAKDASPQSVGSAITYLRRYSLAAMVGIAPEDDDGQTAQPVTQSRPRPAPVQAQQNVEEAREILSEAKQSAAPAGVMTVPFGRDKGKPITAIKPDQLQYLRDYFTRAVDDPAKEKYRADNERALAAVLAEISSRDAGGANA